MDKNEGSDRGPSKLLIGGPKLNSVERSLRILIIGCDYHPSWQQICWLDTVTGETAEQKLDHASGEAEKFYRGLRAPALIGMWNRPGNCQWFMERLAQLGHELWIGDAAKIRASESTAAARQIRQKLRSLKIRDSALQMTKQEEGARG